MYNNETIENDNIAPLFTSNYSFINMTKYPNSPNYKFLNYQQSIEIVIAIE